MIHGRTHLYEFMRDDGSEVLIEYKRAPYFPGSFDYPPEGGEIAEWEVTAEGGSIVTLPDAEAQRAVAEIYALPWNPYEDYAND